MSDHYFSLFAEPVRFSIDQQKLALTYQALQKAVHPDRFADQSEQAKRIAMQKAALINDAFQTLKSPLRRIEYMLTLKGRDIRNETTSLNDPAFLMQQMEWREALDAIRQSQQITSLEAFADDIDGELHQAQAAIAEKLDQPESDWDVEWLTDAARKLTFIYKLREEIDLLEEQLDDL